MFNENEKQYNGVDLLKIIMAVFVITIHTQPFVNSKSILFFNVYRIIVSTAVPIFFISSGFLIFSKIENQENEKKIWKSLIKVIKLYAIWTLIYMPLTIYEYATNNEPFVNDVLFFIRSLFFIGGRFSTMHLWYLLSLIYSLLLTGILLKFKIKIRIIYFISLLLFVFGSTMTVWINKTVVLNHYVQKAVQYYSYVFPNGSLFIGMFYFLTGIIISKFNCDISILASISFMIFFDNIFIQELYFPISIAVFAIIIFFFAVSIRVDNNMMYKKLREASTVFYFMHIMFLTIYKIILQDAFHSGIDSFIITLICCIFMSTLLIKLKEKSAFKWIDYIL